MTDPIPPYWHTEVDRGFDTLCWVVRTGMGKPHFRRWFADTVGDLSDGEIYLHRCERRGERNQCIRPSHIEIGDKSKNAKHMHALRVAAGEPWTGARKKGTTMPPIVGERIAASLRGIKRSAETNELNRAQAKRRATCPVCGYESTVSWVTKHRKTTGH